MSLSDNEKYWLNILMNDRTALDGMIESLEKSGKKDAEAKRMLRTTQSFVNFLDLILKYGNLRGGSPFEVSEKLIRLKGRVSTKELDFRGETYVIMNGLYIVTDVMFLPAEMGKEFYNIKKRKTPEEIGIPDNVATHTIKFIEVNGQEQAVALLKNNRYIDTVNYNSKWEYPIF